MVRCIEKERRTDGEKEGRRKTRRDGGEGEERTLVNITICPRMICKN